jgi:hypothetical protein
MKLYVYMFLLFFKVISPAELNAQACYSAGTPLLSSLELPATPNGSWQFALTYEYNTLRDVLSGTEKLDDDTRERATYSGLLEVSYGLMDRFSISTLLTLVQQERKISTPGAFGPVWLLRSLGIGDAAILFTYSIAPLNLVI